MDSPQLFGCHHRDIYSLPIARPEECYPQLHLKSPMAHFCSMRNLISWLYALHAKKAAREDHHQHLAQFLIALPQFCRSTIHQWLGHEKGQER